MGCFLVDPGFLFVCVCIASASTVYNERGISRSLGNMAFGEEFIIGVQSRSKCS
jgi:hypothetical protein